MHAPRSSRVRRGSPLALAAGVLVLALAATGCGGGSSSSAGTSTTSSSTTAATTLAACLKQHGVTAPAQGAQAPAADRSKLRAAFQACGATRGQGPGAGGQAGGFRQAALKYAQCMRKQGIKDFPDPATAAPGQGAGGMFPGYAPGSAKASDPAVKTATAACRSLLPGRGAGGNGGPAAAPA
jgi:hypothetical protein